MARVLYYTKQERLAREKHSSLLGQLVSFLNTAPAFMMAIASITAAKTGG
jgi:hypothetical protein